jgi:hypothetical protein
MHFRQLKPIKDTKLNQKFFINHSWVNSLSLGAVQAYSKPIKKSQKKKWNFRLIRSS